MTKQRRAGIVLLVYDWLLAKSLELFSRRRQDFIFRPFVHSSSGITQPPVLCFGKFCPTATQWLGDCVHLDAVTKRTIHPCLCLEWNPDYPSTQLHLMSCPGSYKSNFIDSSKRKRFCSESVTALLFTSPT
jgi:hypothetical protein